MSIAHACVSRWSQPGSERARVGIHATRRGILRITRPMMDWVPTRRTETWLPAPPTRD